MGFDFINIKAGESSSLALPFPSNHGKQCHPVSTVICFNVSSHVSADSQGIKLQSRNAADFNSILIKTDLDKYTSKCALDN